MRAQIIFLTRKTKGVLRRQQDVTAETLRVGRGADNEVHLPDPRVNLYHAVIHGQDNGFYIEAVGDSDINLNGRFVKHAPLSVGNRITVGPYQLEVLPPTEGYLLALAIEPVQPLTETAALSVAPRLTLADIGISKRRWAWLLSALGLGLFLLLPLIIHFTPGLAKSTGSLPLFAKQAWNPGAITPAHSFFRENCRACHQQAFIQVEDQACIQCHKDMGYHADPNIKEMRSLTQTACSDCHKEHSGRAELVRTDQRWCADCHRQLNKLLPNTTLLNAHDFDRHHPEFRPTLVVNAANNQSMRISLDSTPRLTETYAVKFSHKAHLKKEGIMSPKGYTRLQCASCHTPDAAGVTMQTVSMESSCSNCHRLNFEPRAATRSVPHQDVPMVLDYLKDFYGNFALQGGFEDVLAPKPVQRRPGSPISDQERQEALAWARHKAQDVGEELIEFLACTTCHEVTRNLEQSGPRWNIRPVRTPRLWLPKSTFNHAKHLPVSCESCHAANTSSAGQDVLIPGIKTCRECHSSEPASGKVATGCLTCHKFHITQRFVMNAGAVAAHTDGIVLQKDALAPKSDKYE